MNDTAAKPPRTPAEDNPWYLLATLYGEPTSGNAELQVRNRNAWNRYYACRLADEERTRLKEHLKEEEIKPYNEQELENVRLQFSQRVAERNIILPSPDDCIDFENCEFKKLINFRGYVFLDVSFFGAHFHEATDFSYGIFLDPKNTGSQIFTIINFTNSVFENFVLFNYCEFEKPVIFNNSKFHGSAWFTESKMLNFLVFRKSNIKYNINFNRAKFFGASHFDCTKFQSIANFNNAEFFSKTDFQGSVFEKHPPEFYDSKMHEDTNWRAVSWPNRPQKPDIAAACGDAYGCLKREMERLKKHEDELFFFGKEMECRRVEKRAS